MRGGILPSRGLSYVQRVERGCEAGRTRRGDWLSTQGVAWLEKGVLGTGSGPMAQGEPCGSGGDVRQRWVSCQAWRRPTQYTLTRDSIPGMRGSRDVCAEGWHHGGTEGRPVR